MKMTKGEFKRRWESENECDEITYDDIADCYVAWGLGQRPKMLCPDDIVKRVVREAGCTEIAIALSKRQADTLYQLIAQCLNTDANILPEARNNLESISSYLADEIKQAG